MFFPAIPITWDNTTIQIEIQAKYKEPRFARFFVFYYHLYPQKNFFLYIQITTLDAILINIYEKNIARIVCIRICVTCK
jgi:hypothetical protein